MQTFHQLARSYVTISLLAFLLVLSVPGLAMSSAGKLDLNAATTKQLEKLPGIGKELAQRIVDYRTTNGPFKSIDSLVNVKGIGKGTLAKVKELLTIGVTTQPSASK